MLRVTVVALALVVTACSSTVTGQGTPGSGAVSPAPASSGGGFPSSTPATPSAPPSTASRSSTAPAGKPLVDRLMTPPPGSVPWTTPWARLRTPTVRQFVERAYPANVVTTVVRLLTSYGLQEIAHETWYAPDRDQADMILFRFRDAAGAGDRYLSATRAKRDQPGVRSFTVPGTSAIGYYDRKPDDLGNIRAIVYGLRGSIVVEEFYYSPKRLRPADARTWIKAQLARLA